MKIHQKLPSLAKKLCYYYDAFIVGGSVHYLIGKTDQKPKDFDIIISPDKFREAMIEFVDKECTLNSFGGFKINSDGYDVDVWPDTIDRLAIEYQKSGFVDFLALHPRTNKLIVISLIQ